MSKTITFLSKDFTKEASFRLEKKPTKEELEFHIEGVKKRLEKEQIGLVIIWEDYIFIPYKDFSINDINE